METTQTLPEYTNWQNVPETLKTKTRLGQLGLRPAPGQMPAATFVSYIRGKSRPNTYKLYEFTEAVPKRLISDGVRASLTLARQKADQARTCVYCGEMYNHRYAKQNFKEGLCPRCHSRLEVEGWAFSAVYDDAALILDTETTGLNSDAEVVEIAIINMKGELVYQSLVCPHSPIPEEVIAIHGITNEMVATAPRWTEISDRVHQLCRQAHQVIVYNIDFDPRILSQSDCLWGLKGNRWQRLPFECAMLNYAEYIGESGNHHGYRWHKLTDAAERAGYRPTNAHRAEADCQMTLAVLKWLAGVQ
jgi:DNA polymerase III epsilon subunit-like protein